MEDEVQVAVQVDYFTMALKHLKPQMVLPFLLPRELRTQLLLVPQAQFVQTYHLMETEEFRLLLALAFLLPLQVAVVVHMLMVYLVMLVDRLAVVGTLVVVALAFRGKVITVAMVK
jgi:hypothetical protein